MFANAYARALRITNNVVQNNGGGYGTIRVGTPDLPAPNTSNHNENLVIAQNRVIQNAGTNLAGGIGVFAGADSYEIAGNDICGNFSAEYGGGISAYGLSPNGKIHDNRIYFNRSYDEGGGIMIGGELPATPGALSPGSGPVTIEGNQIQDNLANDDGGGIRFLMAGNFPITVRNNMIVNNVSTHEGGGVALDDAPDVRFVNNTVMKNITTATALTSNGLPAPAGLSTGANSTQLQATLPAGSPAFSRPLLFNNIFWDNRAGARAGDTVTGIGVTGDATPINHWDLGTADGSGLLTPTNSVLQDTTGTISSPTNRVADPNVVATYDTSVDFAAWRTNPNFVGAILVVTDLPPNLLGNYHLKNDTSPAYNSGAASKTVGALTVAAPATDYDGQTRPGFGAFDIGADEIAGPPADLAITKTDGRSSVSAGTQISYTITVRNNGPNAVTGATVTDTVPSGTAGLTNVTWTCAATVGSSCSAASGSGNALATTVSLANSGSATITVTGTFGSATSGTLTNTATVTAPTAISDPNLANNTATDSDTIVPAADLKITKSDGVTTPAFGSIVTYTVAVSNLGPAAVTGAIVNDAVPTGLTGVSWTCTPTINAPTRCLTAGGTGSIANRSVNIASGGLVTFTVTGTVATTGTLANTATVAAPSGTIELDPSNNSATDTDTVPLPTLTLPSLAVLDAFNRANANTLGAGWNQSVSSGSAALRVNGNQAFANAQGQALWSTSFGATQGAAFDLANASSPALILKATGGSTNSPANYILVTYDNAAHTVVVSTTDAGGTTQRASFAVTLAAADTLSVIAYDNGSVSVWKNGQLIGVVRIPTSGSGAWTQGTGGGRIGIRLPSGSRVDNFRGGTVSAIAPASVNLVLLGTRTLQLGMSGPDVTQLQTILNNYGFAVTINGAFGPKTQQAVKTLQRRFRLRATGVVNKALLRRLGGGPRLGSRSLRLGMRGSDVTQLQRILRKRGRAVTINGSFGPRTRRAVMVQQQRFGLRATGVANGTFFKRLAK